MNKRGLIAIICFGAAFLCLIAFFPLAGAENLYGSVIRIHVLANSDSDEDQERKLAVRDEILDYAKEHFDSGISREEAEKQLRGSLDSIRSLAEKTLAENGQKETVSVTLSEEYYPTRQYENLSLPSGTYLSLRVMIGEAKGQNWWCVLFPPICVNSAVETEDALADVGMEETNIQTVLNGKKEYLYRFKLLEFWEKTKESFKQLF